MSRMMDKRRLGQVYHITIEMKEIGLAYQQYLEEAGEHLLNPSAEKRLYRNSEIKANKLRTKGTYTCS